MTKFEMLKEQMKNNNGYLIVSDAVKNGISKEYVNQFTKKEKLEKAAAGIYVDSNIWIDSLYILSLKKKIVFSHETALYLHGLAEHEPDRINLAIENGYNASNLRKQGFRVYTISKDMFSVGQTTVKTVHGNTVPVYDIDRTVCDIINIKDKLDIQVFQYALKEYMKRKDKNLFNLMKYAKMIGIEDKVRIYTEVML